MDEATLPSLRRAHSTTQHDPYDQAEQGCHRDMSHSSTEGQPLKAKKTLSLRYSLRSTDSTLAGTPDLNTAELPEMRLPSQEQSSHSRSSLSSWSESIRKALSSQDSITASNHRLDAFKPGYEQFVSESYGRYPNGWPRVAAFLEGCDSFGIYRRFGQCHARLLVARETNLTELENQLRDLDTDDENGGNATKWRLKNRYHEEGLDTTKRDLLVKLENELLAYDELLLKYTQLKALPQTPARDHDSVFKWIWANKPLDKHEYDWIFHQDDFVSLVAPGRNWFESFIRSRLHIWPKSFLKYLKTEKQMHTSQDPTVHLYSTERISVMAKLIVVFFAVLVLFIPVILFLLTSMSRACMAVVVLTFVFIFATMMSLLSEAGVQEVFVGTATYCAVLVTFLGNLQKSIS